MSRTCPVSPALLILPRLRIQNANAISSPLTHGFPSTTAFLGFMWALERKLADAGYRIGLQSVGAICHDYDEQTTDGGYVRAFRLTRNPVDKDGGTAAIVEEGRIHLDVTLVFGVDGAFVAQDAHQRESIAHGVADIVAGMRIAGGSVFLPTSGQRRFRPTLEIIAGDEDEADRQFRRWRRQWLPGFALIARDDLLEQRIAQRKAADPDESRLDAWLDLSRFNWHSSGIDEKTGKAVWTHDRTEGWLVPIPVGYGALSDTVHEPDAVRNARDRETPFRFVESLFSIGQWLSPHRLERPSQLLWYADHDVSADVYRCRNDYAQTLPASPHHD